MAWASESPVNALLHFLFPFVFKGLSLLPEHDPHARGLCLDERDAFSCQSDFPLESSRNLLKTSWGKLSSPPHREMMLLVMVPAIGIPVVFATGTAFLAYTEAAQVSAETESRHLLDGGKPVR